MTSRGIPAGLLPVLVLLLLVQGSMSAMNQTEKRQLKDKVIEMFNHAYTSYMYYAYPADELMPISCKGRGRGTEPSRGDIDDVLGNFSLTLIDTLDTLVVLGQKEEFENAVRKVIRDVSFDSDIVVSLFETNIRVLGGLLGGHVMAEHLKSHQLGMLWYEGELLDMAKDIGTRLLPAFNTTTGIPYPRVNLRYGVKPGASRTGHERDTCTACAGTMILEFAALSRLTGDPIFENKARNAMEFLWKMRHRSSDLVGTVINIHNGDWVRRESGVGAGIDSYYEYMLKAYILLADDTYLDRFNKHYAAVMRYVSQGPMMVDVHMHKPLSNSRNFMDALLAFWPGLQVLKGDLKSAIETHEMLYQVTQRHNFLPEAFTTDFRVHWGQHPLRPEFVESTYFIYKATGDPYYLEVGRTVLENLESHARVQCGFAALKDVTTGAHEDQMDSYVLAETFKYLFLLFSEREDLIVDIDNYIFTTEAHLLPLSLSTFSLTPNMANITYAESDAAMMHDAEDTKYERTCPNTPGFHTGTINYAHSVRLPLKNLVERVCPRPRERSRLRLRAIDFIAGNKEQLEELRRMGIRIATMKDGRVQLLHTASEAATPDDAEDGMLFMQEMIDLSKQQQQEVQQEPRVVQLLTPPYFGNLVLNAGPAQFGYDLKIHPPVHGHMVLVKPLKACQPPENSQQLRGHIAVMERGECMFIDKARQIQAAGAVGGIVIDHNEGTNSETSPLFAMSGDGRNDITIPMLFLFHQQGQKLYEALEETQNRVLIMMGYKLKPADAVMKLLLDLREAAKIAAGERDDQSDVSTMAADQSQHGTTSDQSQHATTDQSQHGTTPDQSQTAEQIHRDQPRGSSQGHVPSDSEATKLLLNKYMKKMKLGDIEVQIAENRQWNKEAESLLQIIEGPGQGKHVTVQLDNLVTSEMELKIAQVYQELVKLLMTHTNLEALAERGNYLKALGDLVETAFTQGERGLDVQAQATLDRLAKELQPRRKDDEGKDNEGEDDGEVTGEEEKLIKAVQSEDEGKVPPKDSSHFYLSESDLDGEASDARQGTIVRRAPEWMGLQDGQVMVDKHGVMYVNDGYDFEDEALSSGDALIKPEEISASVERSHSKLNYDAIKRNFAAQQEILRQRSEQEATQEQAGGNQPEGLQAPHAPMSRAHQPDSLDTHSSTVDKPDIHTHSDSLSPHPLPSQSERTSDTQNEASQSPTDATDPPPGGSAGGQDDSSFRGKKPQDQNMDSSHDEL